MKINILRVFVNEEGRFGNPVGIIVDENRKINIKDRQSITSKLAFSESVFINDVKTGDVSIFNPINEVKFAGHALVGTSYFINKILNKPINSLRCRAGTIQTWQENNLTWIRASLINTPPWNRQRLQNESAIDSLSVSQMKSKKHVVFWAWIDKTKGIIRARTFAPDWGIPEDEANGSGSMQLAVKLGRPLEIHHGKGSIIYAKPAESGFAEVGGRVNKLI